MRCPKCGYRSFHYLDACKACGADLTEFKLQRNIWGIMPGPLNLLYYEEQRFAEGGGTEEVAGILDSLIGLEEVPAERPSPTVEIDDSEEMSLDDLAAHLTGEEGLPEEGEEEVGGREAYSIEDTDQEAEEGTDEAAITETEGIPEFEGEVGAASEPPPSEETSEEGTLDLSASEPDGEDIQMIEEEVGGATDATLSRESSNRESPDLPGAEAAAEPVGETTDFGEVSFDLGEEIPASVGEEPTPSDESVVGEESVAPSETEAEGADLGEFEVSLDLKPGEEEIPLPEVEEAPSGSPAPSGKEVSLEDFSFDLGEPGQEEPAEAAEESLRGDGEEEQAPAAEKATEEEPISLRAETVSRGPAIDSSDADLGEIEVLGTGKMEEQAEDEGDSQEEHRGPTIDLTGIDLDELAGRRVDEVDVVALAPDSPEDEGSAARRTLPSLESVDFDVTDDLEEAKKYVGARRNPEDEEQPGFVRPPEEGLGPEWDTEDKASD